MIRGSSRSRHITKTAALAASGVLGPATTTLRRLARAVVDRSIGLLPLFDLRLRTLRWRGTRASHRLEDRLVAQLRHQGCELPHADVVTIVATYRRPTELRAAVDSALAQDVVDHAVVVVDDGGGMKLELPDDPRLTLYTLPCNIGTAGVVRNVGIRLSNSRLIAFLDDDNSWESGHLRVALDAHRAGADLSYSGLRRVRPDGSVIDVVSVPFDRQVMKQRTLADTNTIVVRRGQDVRFSRVRRRRGDFPLEDWELVWRLSRSLAVAHVPDVTVRYVCHPGSNYSEWGLERGTA